MSDAMAMSRRTFLTAGAATVVAGTCGPGIETARAATESPGRCFSASGQASREADHTFAEHEYRHYQRMRERHAQQGGPEDGPGKPTAPNFSRTVDAVEEFGVDPSGGRPIGEDIDSLPEDTLVEFPAGTFRVSGRTQFHATKAGVVGAGIKGKKSSGGGKNTTTFVAGQGTFAALDFKMETGLVGGFALDFTAPKALITMNARSSGFVQYRDVVWNGLVDTVGSPADDAKNGDYLCAMQPDEGATARATRFIMRYNGIPGTKNIGGRNGFWCGETNRGTAQIENCVVQAIADNGVYGGRTPGNVQIKGGQWINNEVSQNRISGAGSFVDGVTIKIDADAYKGPVGDYGGFNEKIATSGIQIERGDNGITKPSGAVVRNADIRIRSLGSQGLRAAIAVLGSGGSLKVENTRVALSVSERAVSAQAPGSGYSGYVSPPPHNVTVTNCLFSGSSAEVVVEGRANSLVSKTCFQIPGASPEIVNGMRLGRAVSFGKQCSGDAGLSNPKKVGSPGKLPPVPIPDNPGDGGSGPSRRRRAQWFEKFVQGVVTFLVVVLALGVVVVGLPVLFLYRIVN